MAKIDLRRQSVIGDHAPEQVGRNAADKSRLDSEPRHADSDVEAGSADRGHERVAPVHGLYGQEVDQGISTAQHHCRISPLQERQAFLAPRMATRLS
jgi:hypothetical protein